MTATARRAAVAVRIPSDGTEMRETAIVVRDALRELGMKPPWKSILSSRGRFRLQEIL
jgi:hypothetical protein